MLNSETKTAQASERPALSRWYLVRLGVHGQVGRLGSDELKDYRRGTRVVCRTLRGLEVGHVLSACSMNGASEVIPVADGRILRTLTTEDEMLWQHLQQYAHEALEACEVWLADHGITSKLLEVEPLLDGKTIYFHFLSEVDDVVQGQLDELAAIYERRVRESKFAQLLNHGCGPGCGTKEAKNGCGSQGGCAVCKVAHACQSSSEVSP